MSQGGAHECVTQGTASVVSCADGGRHFGPGQVEALGVRLVAQADFLSPACSPHHIESEEVS